MAVNKAKNHYLGKEGCARLNCAQAVVSAFQEHYNLSPDLVQEFEGYGRGKAPQGLCGAYYAARHILEQDNKPAQLSELKNYFLEQAGALECQTIRHDKKLSCVGCVEKSAEFLARK